MPNDESTHDTLTFDTYVAVDVDAGAVTTMARARLAGMATDRGLVLAGSVDVVREILVADVDTGETRQLLPLTDPRTDGRQAIGKQVTFRVSVAPDPLRPVVVTVDKKGADEAGNGYVRATLPDEVQATGGMVTFRHGLPGEPIITASRKDGAYAGYLFAVLIADGEHELKVDPGTVTVTAWAEI